VLNDKFYNFDCLDWRLAFATFTVVPNRASGRLGFCERFLTFARVAFFPSNKILPELSTLIRMADSFDERCSEGYFEKGKSRARILFMFP
jgi:hypothetical protein